jgi:hypothetical protein
VFVCSPSAALKSLEDAFGLEAGAAALIIFILYSRRKMRG